MSKKSKRPRRDTTDIANHRLHSALTNPTVAYTPLKTNNYLQDFEDRRTWHPLGPHRPAHSFNRSQHLLTLSPKKSRAYGAPNAFKRIDGTLASIAFDTPKKVLICVRRKIRKSVLFAKGKGGGNKKRPKYNYYSRIKC